MPAHKDNKYWKNRKNHGTKKRFGSPNQLWNEAVEYFEWAKANPFVVLETKTFEGKTETKEAYRIRPLTEFGLCAYLGISLSCWRCYRDGKEGYEDFYSVSMEILNIINSDKIEGAISGVYKENIVSRLMGLADKKQHGGDPERPIKHQITGMEIK